MIVHPRIKTKGPLMYPGKLSPFLQIVGCLPSSPPKPSITSTTAYSEEMNTDSDCESSSSIISSSGSNSSVSSTGTIQAEGSSSFPLRLHTMLDDAQAKGFDYIVSWKHNGTAFKVHDTEKFVETVLPRYFNNQTRYKSFQRQLNIYGFERISKGPNKGLCRHKLFLRGQKKLVAAMKRTRVKDSTSAFKLPAKVVKLGGGGEEDAKGITRSEGTEQEEGPSGSTYWHLSDIDDIISDPLIISHHKADFEGKSFYLMEDDEENDGLIVKPDHHDGSSPEPLQVSSNGCTFQDNQQKMRPAPACTASAARMPPVSSSFSSPTNKFHKQSFPWKLHFMLDEVEKTGQSNIVSWGNDGRGLKVHRPQSFMDEVMPQYFSSNNKKTKWESFQRQLNLYGFVRVPCGKQKGTYVHQYFLRGSRELCCNIVRNSKPKKSLPSNQSQL